MHYLRISKEMRKPNSMDIQANYCDFNNMQLSRQNSQLKKPSPLPARYNSSLSRLRKSKKTDEDLFKSYIKASFSTKSEIDDRNISSRE